MDMKKKWVSIALTATAALAFTSVAISTVAFAAKKVPCYGIKDKSSMMEDKMHKGKHMSGMVMKTPKECRRMGGTTMKPKDRDSY